MLCGVASSALLLSSNNARQTNTGISNIKKGDAAVRDFFIVFGLMVQRNDTAKSCENYLD